VSIVHGPWSGDTALLQCSRRPLVFYRSNNLPTYTYGTVEVIHDIHIFPRIMISRIIFRNQSKFRHSLWKLCTPITGLTVYEKRFLQERRAGGVFNLAGSGGRNAVTTDVRGNWPKTSSGFPKSFFLVSESFFLRSPQSLTVCQLRKQNKLRTLPYSMCKSYNLS
jgi:hypothetical protein